MDSAVVFRIRAENGEMDEEAFARLLRDGGLAAEPTGGETALACPSRTRRERRIELRGDCMRYPLPDDDPRPNEGIPVISLEQAATLLRRVVSCGSAFEVTIWGGRDWTGREGAVRRLVGALTAARGPRDFGQPLRELWLVHPAHRNPAFVLPADVASAVATSLVHVLEARGLVFLEVLVMDGWMASHYKCQDVMRSAARDLPSLDTLRMCGNRVRKIDNDVIVQLARSSSLRTLILSGNPLGVGAGPKSLAALIGTCQNLHTLTLQDCGIETAAMSEHLCGAIASPACHLETLQLGGNPIGGRMLGSQLASAMRQNVRTEVGLDPSLFCKAQATEIRSLQSRNRLFKNLNRKFDAESVSKTGGSDFVEKAAPSVRSDDASSTVEDWVLDYLSLVSADNDTVRSTSLYWVLRSLPDRLEGVVKLIADHGQPDGRDNMPCPRPRPPQEVRVESISSPKRRQQLKYCRLPFRTAHPLPYSDGGRGPDGSTETSWFGNFSFTQSRGRGLSCDASAKPALRCAAALVRNSVRRRQNRVGFRRRGDPTSNDTSPYSTSIHP
jgi:hypothetical protein